jgi:hypothetical protein
MIEPISLTAVGVLALTEGIKFLYGQAGELLKHWRERKAGGDQEEPELRPPADLLEGSVDPARPNVERLERLEGELRERRRSIGDYADGVEAVDPHNVELLQQVDELRRLIEVIYGQRITFKGEVREPSGPMIENEVRALEAKIRRSDVGVVQGSGGSVKQTVDVTRAEIDDSSVGVVNIGPSSREEEDRP